MKKVVKIAAWLMLSLIILFFILFAPVNDKPPEKHSFYRRNIDTVDSLTIQVYKTDKSIHVAWGEVNITPANFIPMAGYRPRDAFETVHDSLFAKVFLIDNGKAKFAIVSIDLLLFPPALKHKLMLYKRDLALTDYYFAATHTHNGFGCWNNSFAGELIAGTYNEALLDTISLQIKNTIKKLSGELLPAKFYYTSANASEMVVNRLAEDAPVDGTVRALQFIRADSSKAMLLTFSGHPTSISKKSTALSADYPGVIAREMRNDGFAFTMFMAGMVGSHRVRDNGLSDFDLVEKTGQTIAEKLHTANWILQPDTSALSYAKLPLKFGDPQLRVASQIKLRSWLFNAALTPLQGEIQLFSLGNINFISTPCDFSGELFVNNIKSVVSQPVIITSFNGDYIGYITADNHYFSSSKEEVRGMNWVGPYHGKMFSEIIANLILKKELHEQ